MTTTYQPRRAIPPRVTLLAAVVAILIGTGAGTTMALLSVTALPSSQTVTAGDLSITVGEMAWEQITPGVDNGASGVATETLAEFESMPGDVVEIRVPVATYLRGDNLVADMTIDCGTTAASGDVSATFHIEDETGDQVAPENGDVPVDEPLTVYGLLGGDAGVTARFEVVVRVEVLGAYQWVTPQWDGADIRWSVGTVRARLDQVRSGGTG